MTEASSPLARSIAPQTCIRSIQWIGTTTQLYASAAELRGGGSILARGAKAIVQHRLTATSVHYLRTVVMRTDRRNCQSRRLSCRRPQLDAWWDLADGCQAPQRDQQLAGGSARIMVLRVAIRPSAVRASNHLTKALCFWKRRNRHASCS